MKMSTCDSPMPARIVSPVEGSRNTLSVGSSSSIRLIAIDILSTSPFVRGVIEAECDGSILEPDLRFGGRWQVSHDSVEQGLDSLLAGRASAEYWNELSRLDPLAESQTDFVVSQLLTFEILVDKLVIDLADRLDQCLT